MDLMPLDPEVSTAASCWRPAVYFIMISDKATEVKWTTTTQMNADPFNVEIVKVVLNKLNGCSEVRLIKLIRNVPANWTELAPLLNTQ